MPEGRKSWSQVPARDYLRSAAAAGGGGEASVQSQSSAASRSLSARRRRRGGGGTTTAAAPPDPPRASLSRGEGGSGGGTEEEADEDAVPDFVHGRLISRTIASAVPLPLPLPLCRVLLLDSSSPVITRWEADRGDRNYVKGPWTLPPSSSRAQERHGDGGSEHRLIASGPMAGAHRTTSYDRVRSGEVVHLSETQVVDRDDAGGLWYTISERMPRRGFSVQVRVNLTPATATNCKGSVTAELRPMGRNMLNKTAVHKAFLLVMNEISMRYGKEGGGLLAGFLNVVKNIERQESSDQPGGGQSGGGGEGRFNISMAPDQEPYGANGGYYSSNGYLESGVGPQSAPVQQQQQQPHGFDFGYHNQQQFAPKGSPQKQSDHLPQTQPQNNDGFKTPRSARRKSSRSGNGSSSRRRDREKDRATKEIDRPSTPSMNAINDGKQYRPPEPKTPKKYDSDDFADFGELTEEGEGTGTEDEGERNGGAPVTVAVKPLPKIRLDLMPAPREEDEYKAEKERRKKNKGSGRSRRFRSRGKSQVKSR